MNVVGRVGNLISQGVYSVATPFHPFGGAVDIIVVEQEDGTYRSTPWYVRFGKFQGVLKGAEKIVRVSVNGVEANFSMFLDNSGEAYFVREVESGSKDSESNDLIRLSSDLLECTKDNSGIESKDICQDDNGSKEDVDNNESYGCHDDRASQEASVGSPRYTAYYGSLDEVEDLVESSQDSSKEMVLISVDGHVLTAPISSSEESTVNVQLSTPQFHLGPGEGSCEEDWGAGVFGGLDSPRPKATKITGCRLDTYKDVGGLLDPNQVVKGVEHVNDVNSTSEDVGDGLSRKETDMSCLEFSELIQHMEDDGSKNMGSPSIALNTADGSEHSLGDSPSTIPAVGDKEADIKVSENDVVANEEAEHASSDTVSVDVESNVQQLVASAPPLSSDAPFSGGSPDLEAKSGDCEKKGVIMEHVDYAGSLSIPVQPQNGHLGEKDESFERSCVSVEEESSEAKITEPSSSLPSWGFEISLCGNLLHAGMGRNSADETFEKHRLSKGQFEASGPSIVKDGNLIVRYKEKYWPWDKAAPLVLGKAVFGADFSIEMNDAIPVEHEEVRKAGEETQGISPSSSSRRWRLWPIPFRRVKTLQHSNSVSSNEEVFVDTESSLQSPRAELLTESKDNDNQPPPKQYVRTNSPTTEQITSLDLKDGQNMVAFSFSTRVLGKQQVDAHIYLWKWNARIVISDVDGTITKSDVLGQFMPLVGKDWTQSGVAGLFSAIKENGYQLLFLSARAIVQAYLTRSFLLNLKQDGKALPNGPVVISPDGLFPSLYREVIRRAPHEFKIACLEDIRALFPSDYNPFYAGFGNRDTDELSYRKMGIPKGKIFIINPKGEVAINHCIDVKSYTSLHTLVNDMFPPTSLAEQEDYNSWNYWKIPLPTIDI